MNTRQDTRRTGLVAGGVLAVVVAIAIAIAVGTTSDTSDASDPAYGNPTVVGQLLPRLTTAADPAAGQAAPVARSVTSTGEDIRLGGGGQPQLLAFLAHWCPHCRAEVPVVVQWVADGGLPEGVELVAVATATDPGQPNFPPLPWLEAEAWPAPVVLDDETGTLGTAYGISAFPFWVVLDAEGDVVLRTSGELTPAQLDLLVEAATGG